MADRVIIRIDGDSSGFKNSIDKIGGLAKTGFDGVQKVGKAAFNVIAGAVTTAGTAMAGAGGFALKLASDLEEVQNVVDVTFGERAPNINKWAKDAGEAFGLSELQAKKYTSTLGAMTKSMGLTDEETYNMSTSLTGLSGDFASFYNLPHDEAFNKIRAGISGETEPLKQLGINMSVANLEAYALSEGITTSYNAMSEAEKVTLRYNYLMSVSADAQGDAARTADSFANMTRSLQNKMSDFAAEIGKTLLPIANEGLKVLSGYADQLSKGFETGGIEGIAGAVGNILADVIKKITEYLPKVIDLGLSVVTALVDGIADNLDVILDGVSVIMETLFDGMMELLPKIMEIAPKIIGKLAEGFIMFQFLILELGLQLITALITGVAGNLQKLIPLAVELIMKLVDTIVTNLPLIIQAGLDIILALALGIAQMLPELVPTIVDIVISIVETLLDNIDLIIDAAILLILALGEGIFLALPKLVGKIPEIVFQIVGAILRNIPKVLEAGVLLIEQFYVGMFNTWIAYIEGIAKAVYDYILKPIIDKGKEIINVGKDLIRGLWDGIKSMGTWLTDKIKNFGSNIISGFKGIFGISSPSKIFAEIGSFLGEGLGIGLENSTDDITKIAIEQTKEITDAYSNLDSDKKLMLLSKDLPQLFLDSGKLAGENFVNSFNSNLERLKMDIQRVISPILNMGSLSGQSAGNKYTTNSPILNFNGTVDSPDLVARSVKKVFSYGLAGDYE